MEDVSPIFGHYPVLPGFEPPVFGLILATSRPGRPAPFVGRHERNLK
jgi:hypothetical protein